MGTLERGRKMRVHRHLIYLNQCTAKSEYHRYFSHGIFFYAFWLNYISPQTTLNLHTSISETDYKNQAKFWLSLDRSNVNRKAEKNTKKCHPHTQINSQYVHKNDLTITNQKFLLEIICPSVPAGVPMVRVMQHYPWTTYI